MNFDVLTSYKDNFEIEFVNFKGTKEAEYEILKSTFVKIDDENLVFELIESKQKIEPLELIVRFISNKTIGDVIVVLRGEDDVVLGKIKFNKILFTKINGLIDFAFNRENKDKEIKVSYECNDITYIGKSGKEEKLS